MTTLPNFGAANLEPEFVFELASITSVTPEAFTDGRGTEGNDALDGDNSHNSLNGRQGDDLLRGLGGKDWLIGQGGNDFLVGGNGLDVLKGGKGRDQFVFRTLEQKGDVIKGFTLQDVIGLAEIIGSENYGSSNPVDDYLQIKQVGSSTVVRIDPDGDTGSNPFEVLTTLNNTNASILNEVLRLSLEEDATFSPDPLYDQVKHYTTTIAADGDPADVYYPAVPNSTADQLPIALMLQGALVDKADYSNYAEEVASYGFVVVVPNNERTITATDGETVTGLFSEQGQLDDVLDQMEVEDADPTSPIFEIADTETLGLLGHSFGGAVGLGATQEEICIPGICSEDDTRPPELKAGIFYGTNFQDQQTGDFLPINNEDIPVGLIAGTLDSVANFGEAASTYVNIQGPPKALIALEGANHYGITNEDNVTREPIRPTLDQATAIGTIARWSGLFLRANLLNDQGAFDYVYNTGGNLDPNVSVISQTL